MGDLFQHNNYLDLSGISASRARGLLPDFSSGKPDDFSAKWMKILSEVEDAEEYFEEVSFYGWRKVPTASLPSDAQVDIDLKKVKIITENVVILNHPYSSILEFDISSDISVPEHSLEYLGNLSRFVRSIDRTKSQIVVFDYPEQYVLSSRRMLAEGEVSSVILTPYAMGGSLFSQISQRELDRDGFRNFYIAGASYSCIAGTAEELLKSGHKVTLVGDAIHSGYVNDPRATLGIHRKREWEDEGVVGADMISIDDFISRSDCWSARR